MNETVYRKANKTLQFYSTQEIYSAPGGGEGATSTFIGMCDAKGYGF